HPQKAITLPTSQNSDRIPHTPNSDRIPTPQKAIALLHPNSDRTSKTLIIKAIAPLTPKKRSPSPHPYVKFSISAKIN
ncbi:MAG: hypothetical protein ACKPFK_32965, partial [Dolichospermum sp.]